MTDRIPLLHLRRVLTTFFKAKECHSKPYREPATPASSPQAEAKARWALLCLLFPSFLIWGYRDQQCAVDFRPWEDAEQSEGSSSAFPGWDDVMRSGLGSPRYSTNQCPRWESFGPLPSAQSGNCRSLPQQGCRRGVASKKARDSSPIEKR